MRTAVIDIGSNTVRLLLAELNGRRFASKRKFITTTRIAEGMAASGQLASFAMERTRKAVDAYRTQALQWGAETVYCYATSAVREASNGVEFMDSLAGLDGLLPQVISGQMEAECAYLGADSALAAMKDNGAADTLTAGNATGYNAGKNVGTIDNKTETKIDIYVEEHTRKSTNHGSQTGKSRTASALPVLDVGGASTELIVVEGGAARACSEHVGNAVRACSVRMGCVVCKEMFIHSDPISAADALAMEGFCADRAGELEASACRQTDLIGVGGSATQLAMLLLRLERYDADIINGTYMPLGDIEAVYSELKRLTLDGRKKMTGMAPERADVILPGVAIILSVLTACGSSGMYASDGDGLEGYALKMASVTI